MFLKNCGTIKVFTLSNNRLGEIIRYPTLYSREKIKSAVQDIFLGATQLCTSLCVDRLT